MKSVSWSRRLRSLCLVHAPNLFARWCTPDDRELGEWGEEIAARYLRHRGCQILGRRFKTDQVEIDIVALECGAIVCVEVKTGRLEPLPRPRGSPAATNFPRANGSGASIVEASIGEASASAASIAAGNFGALRWRPGRRCDADRIARLQRAARGLARAWRGGRAAPLLSSDRRGSSASPSTGEPRSPGASGCRDKGGAAHVDLIEVVLPMVTRRPRLVHHRDVKGPLR